MSHPDRQFDDARAILIERAKRLARPGVETTREEARAEFITFRIGGELHGLESRYVRAVVAPQQLAILPRAAGFILGATNFRGDLVMVADIRPLLGLSAAANGESLRWIICGGDVADLAIVVESVEEIVNLASNELELPHWLGAPDVRNATWLRGVTSGACILLDGSRLLSDRRMYVSDVNTDIEET